MFEYIWADAAAKMYVYRHIKNLGCAQKYCLLGWMVFHNKFELSLQGHNMFCIPISIFFLKYVTKETIRLMPNIFLKMENSKSFNRFTNEYLEKK